MQHKFSRQLRGLRHNITKVVVNYDCDPDVMISDCANSFVNKSAIPHLKKEKQCPECFGVITNKEYGLLK